MGDINKVKTANRLKAKSVTIEDEEGNIFIKNVTQERAVNLRVDGSKTSTKLKTEDALNKFKVKGSSSKVKVSNSNLSVEKRSETKKEKVVAVQDADGNIQVSGSLKLKKAEKKANKEKNSIEKDGNKKVGSKKSSESKKEKLAVVQDFDGNIQVSSSKELKRAEKKANKEKKSTEKNGNKKGGNKKGGNKKGGNKKGGNKKI